MDFLELVSKRHSVRSYLNMPVPHDTLVRVLEAGRCAPSARNLQDWHFYAVSKRELREALVPACAGQKMVAEAGCVLVICGENDRVMQCGQSTNTIDCSIALSYMTLAATELGLGTCWLGLFDVEKVKNVLGIPPEMNVVAISPLGFAANTPAATPRKTLAEVVTMLD